MFSKDGHSLYRVRSLEELGWLEHGFGTRNATLWRGDPRIVSVHQIHSNRCMVAAERAGRIGDADALITNTPGLLVSVRTADCVPILLADPRRRAVAAVHAGWRGTVQNVAASAIGAMRNTFGSRPEDIIAAIGPCIGPCCFEVGPEVAVEFQGIFPERKDLEGRTHVDLPEANRRQLVAAGVPDASISVAHICTACTPEEFYCFRRERQRTGRMVSAIGIRV